MLAVRTPGAPQTARVGAARDSAFPFERWGRLLRSRSISGLSSRSLVFRPTTSLSTLRNGRYRPSRKTWYAAAREALPRSPSQATEFNALARRNAHRTGLADCPHPALGQDFTPSPTTGHGQAGSGVRGRSVARQSG